MFPVTRDMLLYILLGLVLVLTVLIVMIFRKRSAVQEEKRLHPEEPAEPVALVDPDTGPTEAYAIKDRIVREKDAIQVPKNVSQEMHTAVQDEAYADEEYESKPRQFMKILSHPFMKKKEPVGEPVQEEAAEEHAAVGKPPAFEEPEDDSKYAPHEEKSVPEPKPAMKRFSVPFMKKKEAVEEPVQEEVTEEPAEERREEPSPEPVYKEGEIEQGIDLDDEPPVERKEVPIQKPVSAARPPAQAKPVQESIDDVDFVEIEPSPEDEEPEEEIVPEAKPAMKRLSVPFMKKKDVVEETPPFEEPSIPAEPAEPLEDYSPPPKKVVTPEMVPKQEPVKEPEAKPSSGSQKFLSKRVDFKVSSEEVLGDDISKGIADTIGTEELFRDEKALVNQTIAIEGELQLSSKGADFWYVLFDKDGSAVVRSTKEIKDKKCRLTAKVQKTRLGQLYLDVINFSKI
ncbi:MAG: hypothetical protein JW789_04450 [Candidatus Aenigmarchaeota archaeon]|nr:hypothetical protein [Candidatus Aenigmarchaeota archaeon]